MTQDTITPRCMFCNTMLNTESEYTRSEVGLEQTDIEPEQDSAVLVLTCPHCLRTYEIIDPTFEEKQNSEYWN